MKQKLILTVLLLIPLIMQAQVKCYRFSMYVQTAYWKDTSCVACTSDPAVIADVNGQLSMPFRDRTRIINGEIAGGSAGINKNGPHEFLWHFVMNKWTLTDFSPEVCDGRAHTDVDGDTAYFFNNVGRYCPWTSRVAEELDALNIQDTKHGSAYVAIYPNPVKDETNIVSEVDLNGTMELYNIFGQQVFKKEIDIQAGKTLSVSVAAVPQGSYSLIITSGSSRLHETISIIK